MDILAMPIEKLPLVGPRNLSRLKTLGIKTIKDLLWHLPSRYEDFSAHSPIAELAPDQTANVVGKIVSLKNKYIWPRKVGYHHGAGHRKMTITTGEVEDESGSIRVVWFNQPYLEKNLPLGAVVSLAGKIKLDKQGMFLSSPAYEKLPIPNQSRLDTEQAINYKLKTDLTHTGRLIPIYPETAGLTSKFLRFLIKPLLKQLATLPDPLPESLRSKYQFPTLTNALNQIHYPADLTEATQAKRRLAFDELFLFQLRSIINRRRQLRLIAPVVKFDSALAKTFVASLPFTLTNDQRLATFEILKDLERKYPMNRLLNGDVGSGKTVVALIAAYLAAQQGYQAIFLAPTEVLAQQHYTTMKSLLGYRLQIGLLTASNAKQWPIDKITPVPSPSRATGQAEENISKTLLIKKVARGEIKIIIGTQAVLQKGVEFNNPALVVVDEQHRFGVEQRAALLKNRAIVPHLLSMTATPIPRTLALTIYGDLDISLLKTKPAERKPIKTRLVADPQRAAAYQFIDSEIALGRQVFVICPRIELPSAEIERRVEPDSSLVPPPPFPPDIEPALGKQDQAPTAPSPETQFQPKLQLRQRDVRHWDVWADVKAVTDEFKKLQRDVFPHRRIVMLHGKLKPKEKDEIMRQFRAGEYDILVSTSVIEVGIDIPNATVMLIENAERFGLAQLHQFRGRVGRAQHQSYCLLVSGGGQTENQRLRAMVESNDGFKLAEADLQLRGPGEFIGTKQSGLPDLAMAALADIELVKKARVEAKQLLYKDPSLVQYPLLKERVSRFQTLTHFE